MCPLACRRSVQDASCSPSRKPQPRQNGFFFTPHLHCIYKSAPALAIMDAARGMLVTRLCHGCSGTGMCACSLRVHHAQERTIARSTTGRPSLEPAIPYRYVISCPFVNTKRCFLPSWSLLLAPYHTSLQAISHIKVLFSSPNPIVQPSHLHAGHD